MTRFIFLIMLSCLAFPLAAQEAFQVNLGEDGETIGDMRPVFLRFDGQAVPTISPREVARRYHRLFEESEEPEVRIDALNRLANLQAVAGDRVEFTADQEERIYRGAIESYEMIVSSGAFQGRLDELLYQSAKAYAYIGQEERSVERLKQLVGLYPSSSLTPEARFRIAESAYSGGRFQEAESVYKQVLASRVDELLKSKARYMLGWSQFKQGASERAGETFITVLDEYSDTSEGFARLPAASADLIRDTFRIIAILAANDLGHQTLSDLLARTGGRSYDYLLYDSLADYYASRQRYADSVEVAEAFLRTSPDHRTAPAFRAQIVDVWVSGGESGRARDARADYVAAWQSQQRLQELAQSYRDRWFDYARMLGDYHYHQASEQAKGGASAAGLFTRAAEYYQLLAQNHPEPGPVRRLAGDAWLQAGERSQALAMFEQAGYQDPDFDGAADAAWAGLTLRVDAQDRQATGSDGLTQLADTTDRFAASFPEDRRLPALEADIANRMLTAGRPGEAGDFASRAVEKPWVDVADAYSAWLVLAQTRAAGGRFQAAEEAWRKVLALLEGVSAPAVDAVEKSRVREQLATSIYRQGEAADEAGKVDQAVAHFQRIASVHPGSDTAIKGRFDAATVLLKAERWQAAINELRRFRGDYPDHELAPGIGDKLVFAYRASDQPVRAADELITAARGGDDMWVQRLQAAELLHEAGEESRRNALYQDYLAQAGGAASKDNHLGQQQMRQRLIESGVDESRLRRELLERELASEWHSRESLAWAADSALVLAGASAASFREIRLTQPLQASLARKRETMERAREYYRQAESLDSGRAKSESLYQQAELYRVMARDIMASDAPAGLTELEMSQYQFLLEDQAYPFEEKAIELHARNHQLISEGVYDRWVRQSLEALGQMFPGRYARDRRWISWNQENNDGA
ncbi:tetratricopeptide repeat protein [Marinobacter sp.]|uniref:tetratricopeptide repeat protein n=1 Tax=Marinobacter sp. TaxID=50741 RepID=UPI00384F4FB1